MNLNLTENYVSRGGIKLSGALRDFDISVANKIVADLGASTGGFVDALLKSGAKKVYAVEKGFGTLDWKLRNDARVIVLERTDATLVQLPELVDVVTADLGFTRQYEFVPHALSLLRSGGCLVSLVKPQYEASGHDLEKGHLTPAIIERTLQRVTQHLNKIGVKIVKTIHSPIRGKEAKAQEYFMLIEK